MKKRKVYTINEDPNYMSKLTKSMKETANILIEWQQQHDDAMMELKDDRICRRLHDSCNKEVRSLINLANGNHTPRILFK